MAELDMDAAPAPFRQDPELDAMLRMRTAGELYEWDPRLEHLGLWVENTARWLCAREGLRWPGVRETGWLMSWRRRYFMDWARDLVFPMARRMRDQHQRDAA